MLKLPTDVKGKGRIRIGFIGLGISNLGVLHALCDAGIPAQYTVRVREVSAPPAGLPPGTRWLCGEGYLDGIAEDLLVLSPAVRPDLPALLKAAAAGTVLTSDADLFFRQVEGHVFAVTGSDGKSTTTALTGALLRQSGRFSSVTVAGNIGKSLTASLSADGYGAAFAAELSSFQLMSLSPRSERAVITNLTPNHLNWHTSPEEYREAKFRLFAACREPVLNADDPALFSALGGQAPFAAFSVTREACDLAWTGAQVVCTREGDGICLCGVPVLRLSDIPMPGIHAVKNVMAALCLTYGYLAPADARDAVRTFVPLPHRAQTLGVRDGVTYIDSSIDSTPARTAATLTGIRPPAILLLGGRGKGVPLTPLREPVARAARAVILFGEIQEALADVFRGDARFGAEGIPVFCTGTLAGAVGKAQEIARPGDTVLLSPGATSFDEFRGFGERGQVFARLCGFPAGEKYRK